MGNMSYMPIGLWSYYISKYQNTYNFYILLRKILYEFLIHGAIGIWFKGNV